MGSIYQPSLGEVVHCLRQELPIEQGNLPYHNWDWHIEDVLADVIRQCDELESEHIDVRIDRFVPVVGALIHDLWENIPLRDSPHNLPIFKYKEHRAATLGSIYLNALGVPSDTIKAIGGSVLSTNGDFPPRSPEAVVLRRGDINNVTEYEKFLPANYRFKQEIELLKECRIPFNVWQQAGIDKLDVLVHGDRPLHPLDMQPGGTGLTSFQAKYVKTRSRFLEETPESYAEQLGISVDELQAA